MQEVQLGDYCNSVERKNVSETQVIAVKMKTIVHILNIELPGFIKRFKVGGRERK